MALRSSGTDAQFLRNMQTDRILSIISFCEINLNIILKNNWITIVANEEIMYSEFMVYIRWGNLTEMEDAVKQYN